jgi:hypothetical protein
MLRVVYHDVIADEVKNLSNAWAAVVRRRHDQAAGHRAQPALPEV